MEQDVAREKSLMIFFSCAASHFSTFSIISAINSTLWMYTMTQYFIIYANKRVKK